MLTILVAASLAAAPAPAKTKAPVFERLWPTHAEASSTLADDSEDHDARFAFDDDIRTVWVEGKPDEGKGESVTVNVDPAPAAKTLRLVIKNGLQSSKKLLEQNAALARVDVVASDEHGKESGKLSAPLKKKLGEQVVDVPLSSGVSKVVMTIGDVVPGSKYKDTCITDVAIFVDTKVDHARQAKNKMALKHELADVVRNRAIKGTFASIDDPKPNAQDLLTANAGLVEAAGDDSGDGKWFELADQGQPPPGLPEDLPWIPLLKGSLTTYQPKNHERGPSGCAACDETDPTDPNAVSRSWSQTKGYWSKKTAKGQRVTTSSARHLEGLSDEGDGDDSDATVYDFDGAGRLVAAANVQKHDGKMKSSTTRLALFTWKSGSIAEVVVVTNSHDFDTDETQATRYRVVP